MNITNDKFKLPCIDIKLDYKDIAKWFETAKTSEIQMAINEIGIALSEMEKEIPFEDIGHGISKYVSQQSKDFWSLLIKAMTKS